MSSFAWSFISSALAAQCFVPSCLDHLRLRSLERASQSSSVPCSLLPLRVVEQHPVWAIGNAHRDANGPLLMCWDAPELEVLRPPLARHALAPVPVCLRPHLQVLASRVRPLVCLPAIRYGMATKVSWYPWVLLSADRQMWLVPWKTCGARL